MESKKKWSFLLADKYSKELEDFASKKGMKNDRVVEFIVLNFLRDIEKEPKKRRTKEEKLALKKKINIFMITMPILGILVGFLYVTKLLQPFIQTILKILKIN